MQWSRRGGSRGHAVAVALSVTLAVVACSAPTDQSRNPIESEEPSGVDPEPAVPESRADADAGTPDPPPRPIPENGDDGDGASEAVPAVVGAGGVSAGDVHAVEAGLEVLANGGNAVDGAVAAAFAVSVVEPFASGIGGGGAAIVAEVGEAPEAYDYREVVASDGRIPSTDTGIPGFVAGLESMHEDHGTLSFPEVVEPSIALAREGVPTSTIVANQLRSAAYRLPVDQLPQFFPGGSPLAQGDQLVQEELARTLEVIAEQGADALYRGDLGASLSSNIDGIDPASLAAYEVQHSTPPSGSFAGYEVIAAAPPLPGTALIQMLQIAEAMDIDRHPPGSADHIHILAMAWRVADQLVGEELGDPEFVDPPPAARTDAAANAGLAEAIPMDRLSTGDAVGQARDSTANTTHVTVVDADGMMVSMTNTLTNFWGSGQIAHGFFLNDQMRRFSVGSGPANTPEAGRRSVSWSLPTLVRDEERRPVLGIGSPGGRRIPNILTQVLVSWGLHGRSLQEAVDQPRFHLEGGELQFEVLPGGEVADELRSRGYAGLAVPDPIYYFGSVQALEVDVADGEVRGARDDRRDGDWGMVPLHSGAP